LPSSSEPLAATLAREPMTAEYLDELAKLVEQMRIAGEAGDFFKLLKTDIEFHRQIWKISGNKWVERALEVVCPPLCGCYLTKTSSGHLYNHAKDLEEHRALLKVLSEGTSKEVRSVFTQIMDTFRAQELQNFQAAEEATPALNHLAPLLDSILRPGGSASHKTNWLGAPEAHCDDN